MVDGFAGRAMRRLLAAVCVLGFSISAALAGPIVSVQQGKLEGTGQGAVEQFLGIPFAAPPVGPLRWAAPAPVTPWTGIRPATQYASKCVQNGWIAPIRQYRNEDCLYLNVYRPAAQAAQPRPVLVWFHGGAAVAGSSQDVDGSAFAAKTGQVVISVNYRLGAFGMASFAQSGSNFWLRDQQAALRWVQANAKAFGGDPRQVTIMGQSAGAYSVTAHLVSPASAGLFVRAIAMSLPVGPIHDSVTAEQERSSGPTATMVDKAGCAQAPDVLACMRAQSTEAVFEAGGGAATRAAGWRMVIDGEIIPDNQMARFARGEFHRVPILVGFTSQENGFFLQARRAAGQPPLNAAALAKQVAALPDSARVQARYTVQAYGSPTQAAIMMASDRWGCQVQQWARVVAKSTPVFMYEFADPNAPATIFHVDEPKDGPFHNSDIPYVFQSGYPHEQQAAPPAWTAPQKALSDRMLGYYARFSASGVPATDWPASGIRILDPNGDRNEADGAFDERHACGLWAR
ncbi:carboxylesterase/lipase family protein [Achromobacter sp. DH1f]|uniref:carboxylesterase/lipase family protein n=1 Tax=Achromobacter sp. DH1f TaxID=1397275 RepID=UPI0009DE7033|nr:carboxylesterase family protein [Achromobacter sp. DH1f]